MRSRINHPAQLRILDRDGQLLEEQIFDDELDLVTGLEFFDSEDPEEDVSCDLRFATLWKGIHRYAARMERLGELW